MQNSPATTASGFFFSKKKKKKERAILVQGRHAFDKIPHRLTHFLSQLSKVWSQEHSPLKKPPSPNNKRWSTLLSQHSIRFGSLTSFQSSCKHVNYSPRRRQRSKDTPFVHWFNQTNPASESKTTSIHQSTEEIFLRWSNHLSCGHTAFDLLHHLRPGRQHNLQCLWHLRVNANGIHHLLAFLPNPQSLTSSTFCTTSTPTHRVHRAIRYSSASAVPLPIRPQNLTAGSNPFSPSPPSVLVASSSASVLVFSHHSAVQHSPPLSCFKRSSSLWPLR